MIAPTGLSMRLAAIRSMKAKAPGPLTSSLVKGVRSKRPTRSRAALCSAPMMGDQKRLSHPVRVWSWSVEPSSSSAFSSNHCGRSHPAFSTK